MSLKGKKIKVFTTAFGKETIEGKVVEEGNSYILLGKTMVPKPFTYDVLEDA